MSKLSRRALLKWGALGTGAVVLAACAPKQAAPAPAAEQKPAAPVAEAPKAAPEKITLRYLTRQGDAGNHMREFAKRYADESGGKIEVVTEEVPWGEVQKTLETQLVTDTMVDMTWGDTAWWPYLAKRGAFLVIEDFWAETGEKEEDWFNMHWFRRWTDGKLSGVGGRAGFHPGIAFYNKDWVLEAWGKEPWDDWTIDDYVECMDACVQLKGGPGNGFFGGYGDIGGAHAGDGYLRNWGGYIVSQDGTHSGFADEKAQDSIKFQREMIERGLWPGREDVAEGQFNLWMAEKMAIYISNPGASQGMKAGADERDIEMGVVIYPKGPAALENPPRIGFCPYANTMGIYAKTKYPREAFGLMMRVASSESFLWLNETTGSSLGAKLDAWHDPKVNATYPWFSKTADVMAQITDMFACPANTRYAEWRDVSNNEIPPLVWGDMDYTQANIQAVNDHMQEILDLPMPAGMS
jgi:ABC-type glycerol-3-phosphate transport system substrate-binding protein